MKNPVFFCPSNSFSLQVGLSRFFASWLQKGCHSTSHLNYIQSWKQGMEGFFLRGALSLYSIRKTFPQFPTVFPESLIEQNPSPCPLAFTICRTMAILAARRPGKVNV